MLINSFKSIKDNLIHYPVKRNKIKSKVLLLQKNYLKINKVNYNNLKNKLENLHIKIKVQNINLHSLAEKIGLKASINKPYNSKNLSTKIKT